MSCVCFFPHLTVLYQIVCYYPDRWQTRQRVCICIYITSTVTTHSSGERKTTTKKTKTDANMTDSIRKLMMWTVHIWQEAFSWVCFNPRRYLAWLMLQCEPGCKTAFLLLTAALFLGLNSTSVFFTELLKSAVFICKKNFYGVVMQNSAEFFPPSQVPIPLPLPLPLPFPFSHPIFPTGLLWCRPSFQTDTRYESAISRLTLQLARRHVLTPGVRIPFLSNLRR